MKNEIKHTAHSSYRCEYHIVFAPKFRRKVIYGELKKDIGVILRKLCNEMKVEIIEAEACPDHIHMLVSIPEDIFPIPLLLQKPSIRRYRSSRRILRFSRRLPLKKGRVFL